MCNSPYKSLISTDMLHITLQRKLPLEATRSASTNFLLKFDSIKANICHPHNSTIERVVVKYFLVLILEDKKIYFPPA